MYIIKDSPAQLKYVQVSLYIQQEMILNMPPSWKLDSEKCSLLNHAGSWTSGVNEQLSEILFNAQGPDLKSRSYNYARVDYM
jgi:hypothetical protein